MATRIAIPFSEIRLRVVGPKDSFSATRIQRLDVPTTLPSTTVDELGNNQHAGVVTDIPDVTATFAAMDVSHKLYSYLTGTDPAAFPASGVDVNTMDYLDIIADVKDKSLSDFIKSMHVKRARVTGFTFTYSVDGESTEEYTCGASMKRWFKNDIVVDQYDGPDAGPLTLTETPITLKNGDELLSFIVNGVYWDEDATPSGEEYSVTGTSVTLGQSLAAGESAQAVYHANPAGTNWAYVSDATIPAAVRGKDVPVKIDVNEIERVQSVTIRGTFPATRVTEMGNDEVVGYTTQVPVITGDITVLDTDTELIGLLVTGELNPSDTEFGVTEFENDLSLEVKILDPADETNATVLKTVYIPQMTITSEGHTSAVGGNVTQTYGWESTTAQCIIYSGAKA